ncbi:ABC transporter ATP-binding protein [Roseovarius sp.]|uniref:ABC transporter ATP-binding protein n=1 Tax=Roseovarius sp. TaxID=1486281 RepID=UPI00263402F5|nr:ABC transporter ATP-binding protein [Roseovarius sp.]MDM8164948.1 ABC transporter ATP-binding protein [Roseovarius sp.]
MSEKVIDISNLNAFYGELHILQNVSLHACKGEVVSLLGRNGAGKTTLLKSVFGIGPRRKGSIRINGTETTRLPPHKIAKLGLAYCPEERGIFADLTVAENMYLPPALRQGGLGPDEIDQMFPNLRERWKTGGAKLSGGEQQMLSIARILRAGADILLLDEPSEGLAPAIIKQIAQLVVRLKARGMTILLVEQNLSFAKVMSDRYYVIDSGIIRNEFDRAQVLDDPGVVQRYLSL